MRHQHQVPSGSVPYRTTTSTRGTRPQLPGDDPFYDPPQGFQHAAPGTVLRSRDVELAFLGLIPQKFTATQLLYRTTDMNGAPEATVTTVIVPAERATRARLPGLSYQCAIDAVTSRCFPSYALRRRALAPGALAQFEFFLIAAALAEGWAVSVPDHEGTQGIVGHALRAGLPHPRRPARRRELRAARAVASRHRSGCGGTPAVAWPPRGPPRCRLSTRQSSTSSARCSDPRSAIWAMRSAASTAASTPGCPPWWWPRWRTSIRNSTGSSRSTPPTRARRCCCASRT